MDGKADFSESSLSNLLLKMKVIEIANHTVEEERSRIAHVTSSSPSYISPSYIIDK